MCERVCVCCVEEICDECVDVMETDMETIYLYTNTTSGKYAFRIDG